WRQARRSGGSIRTRRLTPSPPRRRPSSQGGSILVTSTPTPSRRRACTATPALSTSSCMGPSSSNSHEKEGHMDRMNRRGFLECMAWAGTGLVWTVSGGVLSSRVLPAEAADTAAGNFTFVQISDTHVGFKGEANPDAAVSLQQSIAKINALPTPPAFILHTGDITHGQKPGAFDTVSEILKGAKAERVIYIPGEHDVFLDGGKEYLGRFANGGPGWQSFDYKGVHFVALVNVLKYKGAKVKGGEGGMVGRRPDCVEEAGPRGTAQQHAGRRHGPRAPRGGLPAVGLDDRRRAASDGSPDALRIRHGAQRAHPPGAAEGGRQRHLPHRDVHGRPAARSGCGPGPGADEDSGGPGAPHARRSRGPLRGGDLAPGRRRLYASLRHGRGRATR